MDIFKSAADGKITYSPLYYTIMPRKNNTPPHTPYTQHNPCDSKRQFNDERSAQEAAEYQMLIKPTLDLSTYRCQWCNKWHLTRQSKEH